MNSIQINIMIDQKSNAINNNADDRFTSQVRVLITLYREKKPRRYKSKYGILTYCHTFADSRLIAYPALLSVILSVVSQKTLLLALSSGSYGTTCIPVIPVYLCDILSVIQMLALFFLRLSHFEFYFKPVLMYYFKPSRAELAGQNK